MGKVCVCDSEMSFEERLSLGYMQSLRYLMTPGWKLDLNPWPSVDGNASSHNKPRLVIVEASRKPGLLDTAWSVGTTPGREYLRAHEKSIGLAVIWVKARAVCQVKPNSGKFDVSSLPPNPRCQI